MPFTIELTNRWLDRPIESKGRYHQKAVRELIYPAVQNHTPLPAYCRDDAIMQKIWRCYFLIGGTLKIKHVDD